VRRRVSKNRNAVAGLLALAVIAVLTFFAVTKDNPLTRDFEIRAAFKDVQSLQPNSPVRIAGVTVGKVTKIDGHDTGAIVTMQVRRAGLPIHRDAKVKVRPRIFLEGNWFVDLAPGTPSARALRDGETIPVQQTAAPVQFGQVLEALQSDTREDLQTVLDEYGRAVKGRGGKGFNASIRYWKPAFQNSSLVNDATRGVLEHDLSNYLDGSRRVAKGLDRDPAALKALITDLSDTAGALADEQHNLSAAIDELPTTLDRGYAAFGALRRAFPAVRRLAGELEPTARSSVPALKATEPLVRQLRLLVRPQELQGLVADLRPTVPALVGLNRGGAQVQEQTRALSSCQSAIVEPWAETTLEDPNFKPSGPIYQEASKQFTGLAAESRSFDAHGQYVRSYAQNANYAYLLGDGRFYTTDQPLQGVNPPRKTGGPPAFKPDVPCETQEGPDMRSKAAAPPRAVKVAQHAPGADARRAKVQDELMKWMGRQMKMSGLDQSLKLVDEPLKRSELGAVVETLEGKR
jgi:phospholipid/cholesterol/gamma-HCH transport system substrate-binding protein